MTEYNKRIVYLSDAQRQELFTNGSITVDGKTITYDPTDIYVTPQDAPLTDVQVNGTSVVSNGVANVPIATTNANGAMSATDKQHLDAVYADYSSALTALGVT